MRVDTNTHTHTHTTTNTNTNTNTTITTRFTYPEQSARYIVEWVRGAREAHGLDIDYVGIWNESPWDDTYIKTLRRMLDAGGFNGTRIVAPDGGYGVCADMAADPELSAAVDVVGLHYPGDYAGVDYTTLCPTGQPIWASEESSSYDDLNGAACW